MKLATVKYEDKAIAGVIKEDDFYGFQDIDPTLPTDMISFIEGYDEYKKVIEEKLPTTEATCRTCDAIFLSPIPRPTTFRDFMCFEEHVINSGKAMQYDEKTVEKLLEVWRSMPAFYFSNTNVFYGQDEPITMHPVSKRFDMEFEIAVIIGKKGINLSREEAMDHIFGLSILNDWSARDIQAQEMQMQLGPAKGKDYANSMGPVIVTMDEVAGYAVDGDPQRFDMPTKLYRNGELLRENNVKTIYHTFGDMIAHASKLTAVYPGDVLGSGTIGGGALLEYLGKQPFIQAGDVIEMKVEGLGSLRMEVK